VSAGFQSAGQIPDRAGCGVHDPLPRFTFRLSANAGSEAALAAVAGDFVDVWHHPPSGLIAAAHLSAFTDCR